MKFFDPHLRPARPLTHRDGEPRPLGVGVAGWLLGVDDPVVTESRWLLELRPSEASNKDTPSSDISVSEASP